MTENQYKDWLDEQLLLAITLDPDNPSDMERPDVVALKAAKYAGRKGWTDSSIMDNAGEVETPFECAKVLIDCIHSIPDDGPADPSLLAIDDVARLLGKSSNTVSRWINDRELRASNLAARGSSRANWIIRRGDLDTFLKNRQLEPQAATSSRRSNNGNDNGSIQFY